MHPFPPLFHETKHGQIYHGNSIGLLHSTVPAKSVSLVFTSPPFGLVRKKSYGNVDADEYVEWFKPFATGIHRVLKPNGSFVLDIGGAWICGELHESYLKGALARFDGVGVPARTSQAVPYEVFKPCALDRPETEPLQEDGCRQRKQK